MTFCTVRYQLYWNGTCEVHCYKVCVCVRMKVTMFSTRKHLRREIERTKRFAMTSVKQRISP